MVSVGTKPIAPVNGVLACVRVLNYAKSFCFGFRWGFIHSEAQRTY